MGAILNAASMGIATVALMVGLYVGVFLGERAGKKAGLEAARTEVMQAQATDAIQSTKLREKIEHETKALSDGDIDHELIRRGWMRRPEDH